MTASGTVQGATVTSTGDIQHRSTSLETIRTETQFDYVASGGVWSGDAYASTRNASMTALVCYINGRRGTVSVVTARSFTASKDTYIDVLNNAGTFSLVYTEVANNAASPALAANSIRLAIIVTGAGNIANVGSINQGEETKILPIASSIAYSVTDSLGNLICPRDPARTLLGQRTLYTNLANTTGFADLVGANLVVNIPNGRKAKITVDCPAAYNSVANNGGHFKVIDVTASSTSLREMINRSPLAAGEFIIGGSFTYTPPASGVRNLKVQFQAATGGTFNTNGSTSTALVFKVELD